ncbi:MAG: L,D-transpeptidase family protein [Microbacterium sp.]|uniref:L,D-transpeptidase family protein n=1 Tax=Microbacterium sp. TaxID=51671 RepID=UPI0019B80CBD|nr:L,D-transpeptidase family protein [Microbacterium sp.]MBD3757461.1 L,D-transpeptidase family protein [Microbacterium sp.]
MTDLATKNEADGGVEPSAFADTTATTAATAVLDHPDAPDAPAAPGALTPGSSGDGAAPVQWAPAEPAPKRKRLWLWIGAPVALVAAGAVAASLVLIAPGTAVAGVPVGFMTPGAATDAIDQRLASTSLVLGDGGPTVTGADLGAAVDAAALASAAFDERPMWNVTQWFGDAVDAPITLDADAATAALRAAVPAAFTDPTPAAVSFDGTAFVVTPAVDGTGIDVDAVTAALHDAFVAGKTSATTDLTSSPVASPATTEKAQAAADQANAMLANIGFYVGDERTVPVDAATAAGWLTVTSDASGAFTVTADPAKIQPSIDALAAAVNRPPVNGGVIVNSAGSELGTAAPGQDGRTLGDTSSVASDFAAQLAEGNSAFALPVTITPATMVKLERLLEVNLSEQRMYVKENGVVLDSWYVSTGRKGAETETGHYNIGWKTPSQTMTGIAPDSGKPYVQEDVLWAMYFNGDQAFHGVYWHSNWGNQMSAGCVGMPEFRAEQIYEWAPQGVDVWVHY